MQLELQPLEHWLGRSIPPVVVAGPCSAESEEQVVSTARQLAASGRVSLLRAGAWKPRTHPASFQGAGRPALAWLRAARRETGLPVTTEVANPRHVEESLQAGIDVLWIGARTTVSPFNVEEIASSLRGVDVPVMVKNPLSPDIGLWLGAFERLNRAGVSKLVAIHRGFSSFHRSCFRYEPRWQIPIELRRRAAGLPMLCDPSHITGNPLLIQEMSQTAMDLGMEGLMIEVHVRPREALSDSDQQITPRSLERMLANLVLRRPTTANAAFESQIAEERNTIDVLDRQLLDTLAERQSIVDRIAELKGEIGVTSLQLDRWREICRTRDRYGRELGLGGDLIREVFEAIHTYALLRQRELMRGGSTARPSKSVASDAPARVEIPLRR